MAVTTLSSQMQSIISTVLSNTVSGLYTIGCTFFNTNTNFQYDCLYIESLHITQDFLGCFCDTIMLYVNLRMETVVDLLENIEDLKCKLIFKRFNRNTGSVDLNYPPKIYIYRAIFEKLPDINKETYFGLFTKKEQNGYDTNDTVGFRTSYGFQLYNDRLFSLRKENINFIGSNCTVKDIICTSLYSLGIQNINIIEPDNISVYKNFVVPPNSTIENILDILQEKKGVYAKGCECYITDDLTCYIYPPYETIRESMSCVHIYNIPEGYCSGSLGMHYVDGKSIYILSNSRVVNERQTEFEVENRGSCISMQDTTLTIDALRTTDSYSGIGTLNDNSTYILNNGSSQKLSKNTTNIKHVQNPNLYSELTKTAASEGQMLFFGWSLAEPFLFEPCQRILYHFDTKEGIKASVGVCHMISYSFIKGARISDQLYGCEATIQAFVSNTTE